MPRPITWLPRLAEIRRSVKHSTRSHYERKDSERVFELQPRAAQALGAGRIALRKGGPKLPRRPCRSRSFLDHIYEGADPAFLLSPRSDPWPAAA